LLQQKYNHPRRNHQINISPIRLIDADGTMLGIKTLQEALGLARSKGLDLVEISPTAKPPVCKVLDYSKYLYEQDKKQRDAKKKQKASVLKEIKLRPRIASHDVDVKLKHAEEILANNDKVRVIVEFRGRENQHRDLGAQLLDSVKQRLVAIADVEGSVQTIGNRISMTLMPKTSKN